MVISVIKQKLYVNFQESGNSETYMQSTLMYNDMGLIIYTSSKASSPFKTFTFIFILLGGGNHRGTTYTYWSWRLTNNVMRTQRGYPLQFIECGHVYKFRKSLIP